MLTPLNWKIKLSFFLISSFMILSITAPTTVSKIVITDKTLVVWVSPANLNQRGGGVLTIEKSGGSV